MFTEHDLIVFALSCFGIFFVVGILFEAVRQNLKR
jgi:hypothetical protein